MRDVLGGIDFRRRFRFNADAFPGRRAGRAAGLQVVTGRLIPFEGALPVVEVAEVMAGSPDGLAPAFHHRVGYSRKPGWEGKSSSTWAGRFPPPAFVVRFLVMRTAQCVKSGLRPFDSGGTDCRISFENTGRTRSSAG